LSYTRVNTLPEHRHLFLSGLFVQSVTTKLRTILHQLQTLSTTRLFDHTVVTSPRLGTLEPDIFPHLCTPYQQNKAACRVSDRQRASYGLRLFQNLRHNA